eukprot:CAMPEP_0175883278 /NCGR_PEP_ID=MMETSP0107_2-20121207/43881_1 /TAXON_ID=195067 ORGANISM="Goniomonas pacifica, Strain CCMP1869" /NCGR_SAMPLE_ID=MMETSP0107_2 /ASSEMBLY_ACC=CAM_ASM_000203 /LENGTH=133 /DNA_ID=CAMNT_0017203309 /DNA_START=386 /DNA_END=785 /DNA_ORIENTATION=-
MSVAVSGKRRPAAASSVRESDDATPGSVHLLRCVNTNVHSHTPHINAHTHTSPVSVDHSSTVLFLNKDATRLPSGLNATESTGSRRWSGVDTSTPVSVDHSLTVLSPDADATSLLSGLNATDVTPAVCPCSVD